MTLPGEEVYPKPYARKKGTPESFYESKALERLVDYVEGVVKREGPISVTLTTRRLMEAWGLGRTTKKVRTRVDWLLTFCAEARKIRLDGEFLWRPDQSPEEYAAFRVPAPKATWVRDAGDIPPVEIANAAEAVLKQHVAMPVKDLARATAKLFGIRRLASKVQAHMDAGIEHLKARGGCEIEEGTARR